MYQDFPSPSSSFSSISLFIGGRSSIFSRFASPFNAPTMILRLVLICLLLPFVSCASEVPSAPTQCSKLEKWDPYCRSCLEPVEPKEGTIECSSGWWRTGDDAYIKDVKYLKCSESTSFVWQADNSDRSVVSKADCVHPCSKKGDLDMTTVARLNRPEVTARTLKCNVGILHVVEKDKEGVESYDSTRKFDGQHFVCNPEDLEGKWRSSNSKRIIEPGAKVFCETEDLNEKPMQKGQNRENEKDWEYMFLAIEIVVTLIVLVVSIAVSMIILKIVIPKEKKDRKKWSDSWSVVKFDPDPWNWNVVLNFIHHWHRRTVEEKVKFLERGYAELGYKSSISQMLYIFEYMLMVENHHLVWRPMLNFLIRMKRLVTTPSSEQHLMFKFNSWISYQGQKLMDEHGFLEGDHSAASSDTCSTDPSFSLGPSSEEDSSIYDEDELSTKSDEDEDDWWNEEEEEEEKKEEESEEDPSEERDLKAYAKEREAKKQEKEAPKGEAKGKEKRGGAGADDPVKKGVEGKKEEVKGEEKKEGGLVDVKSAVDEEEESVNEDWKRKDYDIHDAYCRFVGIFLINLGMDGRDKELIEILKEFNDKAFYNITGPIIGALGATQVKRDDSMLEFERIWHRMSNFNDLDQDKPYGSLWEYSLYALGHHTDPEAITQITEFMIKNKKVIPRHIVSWFRGANDRGSHLHLAFLMKNAQVIARKMPMESAEFAECLKIYCTFDHTSVAWDAVERLAARNPILARKVNVPEYRRRAQHFTAHYMWKGDTELELFLKDPERLADIRDAEFKPTGEMAAKQADHLEWAIKKCTPLEIEKSTKERKDPKAPKETKDKKDGKGPNEVKGPKDMKDPKDSK